MEGVSKEDIKRDAEAIGQLMEAVLSKEKQEKEQARVCAMRQPFSNRNNYMDNCAEIAREQPKSRC